MRRTITLLSFVLLAIAAQAQQTIKLPEPNMKLNMTLMEALELRHSERTYGKKEIQPEVLSQILWAACGYNRVDQGKITAPSAINAQDIIVFVCNSQGVFRYEPKEHALTRVSKQDIRTAVAGRQAFAAEAPLSLVLVSDHSKFGDHQNGAARMGMIDSGYVSQNISLICTALGLNTVPRMTMDNDAIRMELGLDNTYDLLLNHPIGYPAK